MNRLYFVGILIALKFSNVQSGQKLQNQIDYGVIPEYELPTDEMIRREGYSVEVHTVTTDDGYLLTLYRIPSSGRTVFLQHGFAGSSDDWLVLGKNRSLAYLLADLGYDVWLGNARGNVYSRDHLTLLPTDKKFWDFSFHEMGIYDLPAAIKFVTDISGKQLIYIGFSMGTTMSYIMTTIRPDIADRVKILISLAPVTSLYYSVSPTRIMARFITKIQRIASLFGFHEFAGRNPVSKSLCGISENHNEFCKNVMASIMGFDAQQIDQTLLPIIMGHAPVSTSVKTVLHYLQMVNSKQFCEFDYGKENLEKYSSHQPPIYNLSNVDLPTVLFYSKDDWFVRPQSIESFWNLLPNPVYKIKITHPKFYHLNFLYSNIAKSIVYDRLIPIVNQYR